MELREGLTIGSYRLVAPAGSGGMAEVWQAYHPRLQRYVAIKFLSSRFSDDPTYLQRFLHEGQAISRLDHPHILTIYDFGEQDGWTYMVSPFVGGGTLAARLRRGLWTVDEAIGVLEPLASALDYAHGEGIVHRDVKPSNVLFTERDRLVLSDFGIARMIERSTLLTQAGRIVGTPMYMSPEQAEGEPATGASDRYSLGVIAYEMLTGRPPFMAETPLAMLRAHIDKPLPPPRALNPAMPEPVEAALVTLLAKDPNDRFPSGMAFVGALRDAIRQSHLMAPTADLQAVTRVMTPDEAGGGADDASGVRVRDVPAPSSAEVEPAPARSDPAAVAPTSVLPPPQGDPAPHSGGDSRELPTYALETRTVVRGVSRRQALVGVGALALAGVGVAALVMTTRSSDPPDQAQAPAPTAPATAPPTAAPTAAAASPTTDPAASAPPSPSPSTATASLLREVRLEGDLGRFLTTLALSPDGQLLAAGATNGPIGFWRVEDGSEVRTFNGVSGNPTTSAIFSVRFSPDGQVLAAGTNQGVQVWDVASGRSVRSLNSQAPGTSSYASAVAFSPDGDLVAGGFRDKIARVWRVSSSALVQTLAGHDHFVVSVAFSPDGQLLATGSDDETIKLWRVADGSEVRTMSERLPAPGNRQTPQSLAFSPDGQILAAAVFRQGVQLWRVADGTRISTFSPKALTVAYLRVSGLLATGGGDGLQLWRPDDASPVQTLSQHASMVESLGVSADGRRLAAAVEPPTVQFWQLPG